MEKENFIATELKKFDIADAVISQMGKDYMVLTVSGLDDKEGYKSVKEARLTVKSHRVEVERRRKELKEDSLRFGRAIDAEAKRITSMLEPIETYLQSQQDIIDKEKERVKLEAECIAKEKLQSRINTLMGYKQGFDALRLEAMSDQDFNEMAERSRIQFESEQLQLQEAEKLRLAEAGRVAKIAIEQQAERDRLAELDRVQRMEAERIRSEQQVIEREKERIEQAKLNAERERLHRIEVEQAQKIAAENARTETERQMKRKAEQEAENKRLAVIEAERQVKLLPDKEKLLNLQGQVKSIISDLPDISDKRLSFIVNGVRDKLKDIVDYITVETDNAGIVNKPVNKPVSNIVDNDDDWS